MTTYSSIRPWEIPWTGKPGRLQSMESQRVRHDQACMHICTQQYLDLIETYIYQGSNTGSWETEHVTHQIMEGDQLNSSPAEPGPLPTEQETLAQSKSHPGALSQVWGPQHSLQGFLLLTLSPPTPSPPNPSLQPQGLCGRLLVNFSARAVPSASNTAPSFSLAAPLA